MAKWLDVIDNGVNLARERPKVAILLAVTTAIVACGYFYVKHNSSVPPTKINAVQTTGDKNQTSGTNNGTMSQTNK